MHFFLWLVGYKIKIHCKKIKSSLVVGKDSLNQDYISYRLGASKLVRSAMLLVCLFVLLLVIVFATPFWAPSFFFPFIISSLLSWWASAVTHSFLPGFSQGSISIFTKTSHHELPKKISVPQTALKAKDVKRNSMSRKISQNPVIKYIPKIN